MMSPPATVIDLFRHPIKGLTPQRLSEAVVTPGRGLPFDRAWALALPATRFDPAEPKWLPKTSFLMLARYERLAALESDFEEESRTLIVRRDGKEVLRAQLDQPEGRTAIEDFFAAWMAGSQVGRPHLVSAPGVHMFSDHRNPVLSLINLASIRALEEVVGAPVEPTRFRANLLIDGPPAWREFEWVGRRVRIGGALFEITTRIDRCAATAVNPRTAQRDMDVVGRLKRSFDHVDMGVYASVVEGGRITVGDEVIPLEANA